MGVSVMSLYVCLQMVTMQPANEHPIKQCVQRDYTHEQLLTPDKHTEKRGKEQVYRDFFTDVSCLERRTSRRRENVLSRTPFLAPFQYLISRRSLDSL